MPAEFAKKTSLSLTSDDETRLERIAPVFDIEFRRIDAETYRLNALDGNGGREVILPATIAHRRLLAEICTRAAKWVPFRVGVSCRDSLLRDQSEAQVSRVAELYARDRDFNRSGPRDEGQRHA